MGICFCLLYLLYLDVLESVLSVLCRGQDFVEWLDIDVGARELDAADIKSQAADNGRAVGDSESADAAAEVVKTKRKKRTTFREKRVPSDKSIPVTLRRGWH